MRREESSGSIHPGLDFIQHEQRAIAATQRLRVFQIVCRRQYYTGLGLNRFHHECRESLGGQLLREFIEIAEWDRLRVWKQRAKFRGPEWIIHQRKRPAGESMEAPASVNDAGPAGVGARKLDHRIDAFAPRTAKEDLG